MLAIVVGLLFHGAMYGPQAAFLSELFGTKVRYSGVSIGYQLASIVAGGLAPIIARRRSTPGSAAATRSPSTSRWRALVSVAGRGHVRRDPPPRPGRRPRRARRSDRARRPRHEPCELAAGAPGSGRIAGVPETALELLRLLAAGRAGRPDRGAGRGRWPPPIRRPRPVARELALRVRAGHRRPPAPRGRALRARRHGPRPGLAVATPAACWTRSCAGPARLLGTDVAYLTLADPERGDTFMRATAGSVSARFQTLRLPPGAGLGGLVAQTRRPYWTADYPGRRALPAHQPRSTPRSARRAWSRSAARRCWSTASSSGCCSPPTAAAGRSAATRWRCSARWPRWPRCRWCRPGGAAETAAALDALSRAHAGDRAGRRGARPVRRGGARRRRGGRHRGRARRAAGLLGGRAGRRRRSGWPRTARRRDEPGPAGAAAVRRSAATGRLAGADGLWAVAVTAAGQRLGTLVLGGRDELDDGQGRTVERAAMVTALVLLFRLRAAEADQRVRTDLLADLLARPAGDGPDRRAGGARPAARAAAARTARASWCAGAARRDPAGCCWPPPRPAPGAGWPGSTAAPWSALVPGHATRRAVAGALARRRSARDGPVTVGRGRAGAAGRRAAGGARRGPPGGRRAARAGPARARRHAWPTWASPGWWRGDAPRRRRLPGPGARPGAGLRPAPRHRPGRHPGGLLRRAEPARAAAAGSCTCTPTRWPSGWTGSPGCSARTGSSRTARWRCSSPCGCAGCAGPESAPAGPAQCRRPGRRLPAGRAPRAGSRPGCRAAPPPPRPWPRVGSPSTPFGLAAATPPRTSVGSSSASGVVLPGCAAATGPRRGRARAGSRSRCGRRARRRGPRRSRTTRPRGPPGAAGPPRRARWAGCPRAR